jgi:hypothetical protein
MRETPLNYCALLLHADESGGELIIQNIPSVLNQQASTSSNCAVIRYASNMNSLTLRNFSPHSFFVLLRFLWNNAESEEKGHRTKDMDMEGWVKTKEQTFSFKKAWWTVDFTPKSTCSRHEINEIVLFTTLRVWDKLKTLFFLFTLSTVWILISQTEPYGFSKSTHM